MGFQDKIGFIWSVADLLRGDYKQADYGKVILPLVVLRRLDCVLEATKTQVLARHATLDGWSETAAEPILNRITGLPFHNTSPSDFQRLKGDPDHIAANLNAYIAGFSSRARQVIEHFGFADHIARLDAANLFYLVACRFCDIDLHPDTVPNTEMGAIFEELIWRFSEQSNETAGEHFTPREVIRLMVDILFEEDSEILTRAGIIRTLYDCAAGTGGMLSVAEEYLPELNPEAHLEVYGQELNPEAFAICNSDMMFNGQAEVEAGQRRQQAVLSLLQSMDARAVYRSLPAFEKALGEAGQRVHAPLDGPVKKAVFDALSERDKSAEICRDAKGRPEPDPDLRDYENVPLKEDIQEYFGREVLPHVPDAWIDDSKTRIGYEIPFTRYFYKYQPLRPLEAIDREIRELEAAIQARLAEVLE